MPAKDIPGSLLRPISARVGAETILESRLCCLSPLGLTFWVVSWPSQCLQSVLRIGNECAPSRPHLFLQLGLCIGLVNASDFSRFSKDHVKFNTVIRSTSGVKTGIIPVCVILKPPGGCVSATSVCGFEIRWTEESLHIEVIPLLIRQYRSLCIGRNLVESRLICVVSDQVRLRGGMEQLARINPSRGIFQIMEANSLHGQIFLAVKEECSSQKQSHHLQ